MPVVPMKALLETGVHFGHRTKRWNPKMKPFIFTERNGVHIIDLQQTIVAIDNAYALIRDLVASGGVVMFIGTKRQAQEPIMTQASRAGQPYVIERFLGGTLTNWQTIKSRLDRLAELEAMKERGEFERFTKKEALLRDREIARLNHRLGGMKTLRRLPDALFIVDVNREANAIKEANKLNIPVIAMVDTNCDPDGVDYVIPSNDDAIRAIKLIVEAMANAALEGLALRKGSEAPEVAGDQGADVQQIGEETLAKIRAGDLKLEEETTLRSFDPDVADEDEL
ncbi:MAG: 30S ribosomal protein S2 [Candidatus Roseilinea sp.]|uniref:30S ribosomal protein S2 n=1 Tax=Candidatus Roseilinea sp. TaxID=2838777 RepID=UPI00404AB8C1